RHTRFSRDWSSDVCSSDLGGAGDLEGHLGALAGGAVDLGPAAVAGHAAPDGLPDAESAGLDGVGVEAAAAVAHEGLDAVGLDLDVHGALVDAGAECGGARRLPAGAD